MKLEDVNDHPTVAPLYILWLSISAYTSGSPICKHINLQKKTYYKCINLVLKNLFVYKNMCLHYIVFLCSHYKANSIYTDCYYNQVLNFIFNIQANVMQKPHYLLLRPLYIANKFTPNTIQKTSLTKIMKPL